MKIIINKCYGGFRISHETILFLIAKNSEVVQKISIKQYSIPQKHLDKFTPLSAHPEYWSSNFYHYLLVDKNKENVYMVRDESGQRIRTHPDLINAIEQLGSKAASGKHAELAIVEVPDGIDWSIDDYQGTETIHEKHRSWE